MKKKILALLCAVIACLGILFAFTACDGVSNSGTGSANSETNSSNSTDNGTNSGTLKMDKKYSYVYQDPSLDETFIIFHKNGTGEYYRYTKYTSEVDSRFDFCLERTIHFKYTFADSAKEAVVCFYESVEYGERDDGSSNVRTNWDMLLTVSENVLCYAGSSGYSIYVCEDYLPQIPNYGS